MEDGEGRGLHNLTTHVHLTALPLPMLALRRWLFPKYLSISILNPWLARFDFRFQGAGDANWQHLNSCDQWPC